MVRCSGAALGIPCFFAVGLHNARGTQGLHLVRLHNIHNASGYSYAQPQHTIMPDSIATHAFCVRVRFKLCKAQAVARPSGSVARGASRPLASPPDPSPSSPTRAPTRRSGAQREIVRIGDDESVKKGMDPTP